MADGYVSLRAPWVGGAADPGGTPAGYHGLLAPWVGGAGSPGGTPPSPAGYRSLLAFWVGGAGVQAFTPVPPVGPPNTGGALAGGGRKGYARRLERERTLRKAKDESELTMILGLLIEKGIL